MNLDYNFYAHIIIQSKPNDLNTIVNKYYKLDNNFVPNDLVYINDAYTSHDDPAYQSVSYTHLDVYKRQIRISFIY